MPSGHLKCHYNLLYISFVASVVLETWHWFADGLKAALHTACFVSMVLSAVCLKHISPQIGFRWVAVSHESD